MIDDAEVIFVMQCEMVSGCPEFGLDTLKPFGSNNMRVIIHAGTHKTATTSFQDFLQRQRSFLRSKGVYYPGNDWFGCTLITRRILQGDYSLLDEAIAKASVSNFRTLLISHEDLETCLAESPEIAVRMEELFVSRGFTEIIWFFVLRKPSEYFKSLLIQQSRHGILLDSYVAFNEIVNSGSLSSPAGYLWSFSFDHCKNLRKFRQLTTGVIYIQGFCDFVRPYPGSAFLADLVGEDLTAEGMAFARDEPPKNQSPGPFSSFLIWHVTARRLLRLDPCLPRDTVHGPVAIFLESLRNGRKHEQFLLILSIAFSVFTPLGIMTTLSWLKSRFTLPWVCRYIDRIFPDLGLLPIQRLEHYFDSTQSPLVKR